MPQPHTPFEVERAVYRLFNPNFKPVRHPYAPAPPALRSSPLAAGADGSETRRRGGPKAFVRRFKLWREDAPGLRLVVLDRSRRGVITDRAIPTHSRATQRLDSPFFRPCMTRRHVPLPTYPRLTFASLARARSDAAGHPPAAPSRAEPTQRVQTHAERKAAYRRLKAHKFVLEREHERRFRLGMGALMAEAMRFQSAFSSVHTGDGRRRVVWAEQASADDAAYYSQMFSDIRKSSTNVYAYLAPDRSTLGCPPSLRSRAESQTLRRQVPDGWRPVLRPVRGLEAAKRAVEDARAEKKRRKEDKRKLVDAKGDGGLAHETTSHGRAREPEAGRARAQEQREGKHRPPLEVRHKAGPTDPAARRTHPQPSQVTRMRPLTPAQSPRSHESSSTSDGRGADDAAAVDLARLLAQLLGPQQHRPVPRMADGDPAAIRHALSADAPAVLASGPTTSRRTRQSRRSRGTGSEGDYDSWSSAIPAVSAVSAPALDDSLESRVSRTSVTPSPTRPTWPVFSPLTPSPEPTVNSLYLTDDFSWMTFAFDLACTPSASSSASASGSSAASSLPPELEDQYVSAADEDTAASAWLHAWAAKRGPADESAASERGGGFGRR